MATLANLTDQQNMLLTQLSYCSHLLGNNVGLTISEIVEKNDISSDLRTKLKDLQDVGLGDLKIKDVANEEVTGFGAVAFTDGNGNTGIAYRGTDGAPSKESLNDWVDNVQTMITGTSAQSVLAERFFNKNREASGNNYLYGHSKGGELSEVVFVNNYSDIKGIHLLNPQPLNPYGLTPDQLLAMNSIKVDIVVVEGDYVWFLGKLPSYTNIRIIKSNGGNAHVYSSIYNMFDENGNLIPGAQPWWEYIAYGGIAIITSGLQCVGGLIGLTYNSVVRVVDYVKEDLIPMAKSFIDELGNWLTERYQDVKDFGVSIKKYLETVTDNAKVWLENAFTNAMKGLDAVGEFFRVICGPDNTPAYRDFSEDAKNRLIGAVKETEEEEWWEVTRWDCWYKVEKFFGGMQWNDYAGKVDDYYRKIVDMNDASVKDIENIFTKVYQIDGQYGNNMERLTNELSVKVINMLIEVSNSINPNPA